MPVSPIAARRLRIAAIASGGLLVLLIGVALLLLSFGWAWLRHPLEQRLTARLGRTVTIGAIRRIDHGFFQATLAVDNVHVAQPGWAGGGDFLRARRLFVSLPVLPLLTGSVRPETITVDGLEIAMLRKDATHANWRDWPPGGGGSGPGLRQLTIRGGRLRFADFKQKHFFTASIDADDRGLRVIGDGTLIGRPTRIALTGQGVLGRGKWPFRFGFRSPIANADLVGLADKPLDLGHFDATVHAWGDDLAHLDLLVEAGMPGTAPVRSLDVRLRHDRPDWLVESITGTIGRSHFSGRIQVHQAGERTLIQGKVIAAALDFDDLTNARGHAIAAAKRAAAPGRRLPDTAIDLSRLTRTDGTLELDVRRLLFARPSAFHAMKGRVTLDHGTLTAAPFDVALERGTLGGSLTIVQKDRGPTLALDLRLRDSRIEAMATDASAFGGALRGRFVLAGPGRTIRAALGRADGRFAIVGSDGTIGRRTALMLGQDIGRGLTAKSGDTARLRCAIGSFVVRGGKARPAPLLIDTDVTRAEARGLIDLTDERIDLSLTGEPKQASALRLSVPIRVTGRLFAPVVAAPQATSRIGILRSLGHALRAQPIARDADCAALAARALR